MRYPNCSREHRPRPRALAAGLIVGLGIAGCAPTIRQVQQDTRGVLIPTAGSNESIIFVAPVDAGVFLIDLGWSGADAELARALEGLGRGPQDVAAVFLTHAHRDHIAAWPLVVHAPFYLAAAEVDLFLGGAEPQGNLPRLGHRLLPAPRPAPDQVAVRPFSGDTVITLGSDTVRAFLVPGHTRGSAAYLFRGVLFVGDALSAGALGGLRPAVPIYSADPARAAVSARRLLERVQPFGPRFVCTAHGVCTSWEEAVRALGGTG